MQIKAMEDEHLDEIIGIDESTFNRAEPRSIENLKALKMSDPKGCFVITDKNRIIGYNYSKTTGNEGYVGPLGIINEYQNKGLGKALMEKTIEYLCKKCKIIGLEVLPENGNVIGLYQRIGFTSGFPSFLFQTPGGFKFKEVYSNNFRVSRTSEMTFSEYEAVLEGVEKWTQSSYNGVSYRRDLSITQQLKGEILVAFNGDVPAGFLAYSKTLLPTLWGAVNGNIMDNESQKDIMKGLLDNFDKINGFKDVVIQINSRHNVLVDMMMEMGFKLYRSVNRMYLKGFEGDHLKKTDQLIMRPWRG